jgi:hypothetical protein
MLRQALRRLAEFCASALDMEIVLELEVKHVEEADFNW